MALFSDVNRDTTTNGSAECLYRILELLTVTATNKWTVEAWSDGLTLNVVGGITSPANGANGMRNANAWYRIRDPGGRREFVFQYINATFIRVAYSALDRFTTGGTITVIPTAADGRVVLDSVNIYVTAGTYKHHVIYQDTVEGDAYSFWCFGTTAAFAFSGGIFCEALTVGTFPAEDADPVMIGVSASGGAVPYANNTGTISSWWRMNLTNEAFVVYQPLTWVESGGTGTPLFGVSNFVGPNPYTGNFDYIAPMWSRDGTVVNPGYRGMSKHLKLKGSNQNYPDTVDLAGTARVCVDMFLIPWPTSVTPL